MTYKELAEKISKMSEEQQQCDVTVRDCISDEFYATFDYISFSETDDVLDKDHPYLEF